MENSTNDYEKHIVAWENHLAALDGGNDGQWTELTAKEIVKLFEKTTLGLNDGDWEENRLDAVGKVGFNGHNAVHCPDVSVQVVTLVEFLSEAA